MKCEQGGLKLLRMVANLQPLIFATIKEIRPPEVRRQATNSGAFWRGRQTASLHSSLAGE